MTQASDDGLLLNVTSVPTKEKKLNVTVKGFSVIKSESSGGDSSKKKIKKFINKPKDEFDIQYSKLKKSQQGKGRISSLFANNPEIPDVAQKDIKEIQEPVFSKKLIKNIGIHPFIVQNLEQNFNITKTTTVQELSIPVLLSGKDALIRSQTGSGKTLAYAIPVVDSLQKIRPKISRSDGVRAVVVLPTRELALQTYECFLKLVKSFTWLVPGLLIGGEKRKSEKARLRKGVTILIGTPGRLLDHTKHTKALDLNSVQWLILDEADRLLDMGYEKDVASLVSVLESQQSYSNASEFHRQTILLSATLTPKVEQLAGLALQIPVRIDASSKNSDDDVTHLVIPKSLKQFYVITPPKLRLVTLAAIIHWKCQVEQGGGKMLVFMATQDMVDFHLELLSTVLSDSADYFKLHGSMTQSERTQIFKTFREASSGVLLCTDVAARGLDLPHVDWIVQFTAPTTPSDYVHRVGRTARVGHKGSALLFLAPSETQFLNLLEERSIKLDAESVDNCLTNLRLLDIQGAESIQRAKTGGPTVEAAATALQLQFESAVVDQKNLHELAAKGYISWVRFYASYPKDVREAFNFQNLHLGHYAKSFALRDPPSMIGGIGRPKFKKDDKSFRSRDKPRMKDKQKRTSSHLDVSEFDSGLTPRKKKKKN